MIALEDGRAFLVFEIDPDAEAVLGLPRNVWTSYQAAATGALRWPVSLRPEVLIDGTGSLL